jgi:hypothetical protein
MKQTIEKRWRSIGKCWFPNPDDLLKNVDSPVRKKDESQNRDCHQSAAGQVNNTGRGTYVAATRKSKK